MGEDRKTYKNIIGGLEICLVTCTKRNVSIKMSFFYFREGSLVMRFGVAPPGGAKNFGLVAKGGEKCWG